MEGRLQGVRVAREFRRDPYPRASWEIITALEKSISKLLLSAGGTVQRETKDRAYLQGECSVLGR